MRGALKIGEAGDKKFAAPNSPVGAGARAIKGDAEHMRVRRKLARSDGFCYHARDMRMMMLNLDKRQIVFPRLLAGPLAR